MTKEIGSKFPLLPKKKTRNMKQSSSPHCWPTRQLPPIFSFAKRDSRDAPKREKFISPPGTGRPHRNSHRGAPCGCFERDAASFQRDDFVKVQAARGKATATNSRWAIDKIRRAEDHRSRCGRFLCSHPRRCGRALTPSMLAFVALRKKFQARLRQRIGNRSVTESEVFPRLNALRRPRSCITLILAAFSNTS